MKTNSSKPLYRNSNLQIIFLITLMAVLGVSSITPAFPKIAKVFEISSEKVGLLIIVFTLPGIILTPIFGILADRFGRKRVLIPSLILFGIAGTLSAFTRTFELLLLFRFLQGIGAASLGSINVTLLGDIFEGNERAAAMGYNASVLSIATAAYPFIGGLLANYNWYLPFLLPAFSIPIALIVLTKLKNPEPKKDGSLKVYLHNAFNSLKNKEAILYFTASLITFIILYGCYLTYIPIYLDELFNAQPFMIGILLSTMSITTAVVSSQLKKLSSKFNIKSLFKISFLIYGSALFLIPFIKIYALLFIPIIIYGIAHGMNIPLVQTLLANISPLEYRGAFMSMNGMILRGGQTLGPLLTGIFYTFYGINSVFFFGGIISILFSILLFIKLSK
jgi:MFS family permease